MLSTVPREIEERIMSRRSSASLQLITTPESFFQELVNEAVHKTRAKVLPETECYIVKLLGHFMNTENLFLRDSDGAMKDEPLVLKVKEALEETQKTAQQLMFRHVGDVSLYMAGFFQESLTRKKIDLNYYIDMGGIAYQQVAVRMEEQKLKKMYSELSERFQTLVEVLSEVSVKTTPQHSEKDILNLYEIWENTGSERAKKVLKQAGIVLKKSGNKKD